MGNTYLLLRNNKQSGPYSIEELHTLSLQPYDLIWILNQSTSWQFPEEIPALQTSISQKAVAPKPTESHIYVRLPQEEKKLSQAATESQPSFEERVQRLRDQAMQQQETKSTESLDINYSRSLDDIKAEYSYWLRDQKRKTLKNQWLKPMAVAILFSGVVAGSFWIAKTQFSKPVIASGIVQEEVKKNIPQETITTTNQVSSSKPEVGQAPVSVPAVTPKYKETNPVVEASKKPANTPEVTLAKSTEKPTNSDLDVEESNSIAKQIQLKAEYIGNGKQEGVGGLNVILKNDSKQLLKVVAVDVIYFTNLDNELQRKTLYFNNVAPGEVITLQAPAHKQAEGAYARLGLISSEGGSIFYARH